MKRQWIWVFLLAGLAAAWGMFNLARQRAEAPAWAREPEPDLFLVFSAEDRGWLVPSG